jgi:hypothetical protein
MPAMPSRLARYCTLVFSAPPDAVEFTAANLETHVEGGVVQIAGSQPPLSAAVALGRMTMLGINPFGTNPLKFCRRSDAFSEITPAQAAEVDKA